MYRLSTKLKHCALFTLVLCTELFFSYAHAQPAAPNPQNLTQAIADANQLLDRSLKIFQASTPQLEQLKLVTEEYKATLQRWPQGQNIAIEAQLARTALTIGWAYQSKANDAANAVAIYDNALNRWGARNETAIAQYASSMYLQYGRSIERLQADKALQLYDKAIGQYTPNADTSIAAGVVRLLDAKAQLLIKLGRVGEGLTTFDRVAQTYPNPADVTLLSAVAGSSLAKADILYSQLRRRDEATALLNDILKKWDARPEPVIQNAMAFTVERLANNAFEQASPEEALGLYEDLLRRASKLQIHPLILTALSRLPIVLFTQKKYDESLRACDQFLSLYDKATAPNEQYWLARTMLLKGVNLNYLYHQQEAVKTFEQMISRFKSSQVPNVSLLVDEAEKGKQAAQGNAMRMLR